MIRKNRFIRKARETTLTPKTAKKATKKSAKKPVKTAAKKPVAKKPAAKKAAVKKIVKKPVKKPAKKIVPKVAKPQALENTELLQRIVTSLDDDKAEQIVSISLAGRSSLCDAVVVASGRSSRHVAACAEHLVQKLKEAGYGTCRADGLAQGDWALVDAGDVIVHIFRPEVRAYYDLEGMWSVDEAKPKSKPKPKRVKTKAK